MISESAIQECLEYGHRLMLTDKEIMMAISGMSEEEFCKGGMYKRLDQAKSNLNHKWQRKDLRSEYSV